MVDVTDVTSPAAYILAVQDPPTPDGQPGTIYFAPGLSLAQRKKIMTNFERWDQADARRARHRGKGT